MKNLKSNYVTIILGGVLLALGLFLVKSISDPQGIMLAFPYICIGLGCGIFGHGMGNTISHKALQGSPEIQRQLNIEKNDERNIDIANRSKAKAYNLMTYVYGALLLAFALMGIDMIVILLLVFSYLFVQGYGVYWRSKYEKEM